MLIGDDGREKGIMGVQLHREYMGLFQRVLTVLHYSRIPMQLGNEAEATHASGDPRLGLS